MKRTTKTALGYLGALTMSLVATSALAQTKITVWTDTARVSTFEAYDEAHPDVEFEMLTVDKDELVTKLQLAMRAKADVPDVIFMSSSNHPAQLSTRRTNYLADITETVPQDVFDGFLTNANSVCNLNGTVLCLRNDVAHMVLWYDKVLLEELGKSVPETWEEFEQLGAELAAMDKGYFLGSGVQPDIVIAKLASAGCEVGNPVEGKENTLKIDLTSEQCLKAAGLIDRMIENGSLLKFGTSEPGLISEATDGKFVMTLGPTWFGEYVIKPNYQLPAGRLAAAVQPRWADQDEPLAWSWGGGNFGYWRDTEYPEIAADIITWVTTQEDHLKNAVTMPAFESASIVWGERVNNDPYYATNDVYDTMLEAAKYSSPDFASLGYDMRTAFGKTVSASLATDGKLVELLPDYERELKNSAKLSGYKVE